MAYACPQAQSLQSYPTLCDPTDYSPPSSSVHRILQVRTLEWVAMPFSRGSSQPRDWIQVSWVFCIAGRFFEERQKCNSNWPWGNSYRDDGCAPTRRATTRAGMETNVSSGTFCHFDQQLWLGLMAFSLMQLCYCRFNPLPTELRVVVCWGQAIVAFSRILQFVFNTAAIQTLIIYNLI